MKRLSWSGVYCSLLLLFLFAPVFTIVLFSFDDSGRGSLPLGTLSFRWYESVFGSSQLATAFQHSLMVAATAGAISLALGTLAAFALWRRRSRLNPAVMGIAIAPIAMPPLVLGIALLTLYKAGGITLSLATVVIAHVLITVPFVLLTVSARLSNFDPAVEDAARDLGATPFGVFRKITFPLTRGSLFGAGLLAFALSLDEFIVTLLTIGSQDTLPVVIWGQMRRGISPNVNAISTLLLAATIVLVMVTRKVSGATLSPSGES